MKAIIAAVAMLMVCVVPVAATTALADEGEIQDAIDAGLAWLAANQNGDGSWGDIETVGKTGLAVKKFEHDAMLRGYDSPFDPMFPYHQVVEDGLDFLFLHASIIPIAAQPAGDPDTDGDGIGVAFAGDETYETGIALMAIAESMTPTRVVDVPGSAVDGWTYYDVAEDVMNFLAYGQTEDVTTRGGWGYDDNASADGSNTGYAAIGLGYCESPPPYGFGLAAPQFVKDELAGPGLFVDYLQNDVGVGDPAYDGGSGCYNPEGVPPDVNCLQTGNRLFEMAWYGDSVATPRVQDAIDYLVRAWNLPGVPIGEWWSDYQGWLGNYQAMFTVMKGLEALQVDMIDGIDWYDEITDYIVATQMLDGAWPSDYWDDWAGGDSTLSTTWALLTLQKASPVVFHAPFDIKPTSCPNPLNVKSNGLLPAAILGYEGFDVATVVVESLLLEGVPPIRHNYADVATPVGPGAEPCECTTDGPDGFMDLTLKFSNQAIVAALGPVSDGEVRELTITGVTTDGVHFESSDCVRIIDKRKMLIMALPDAVGTDPLGKEITDVNLAAGYPNPTRSGTHIEFSLPEEMTVSLVIYDVRGRALRTLVSGEVGPGTHTYHWDGRDESGSSVASGVYFCKLTAGGADRLAKLMVIE